MDLKQIAEHINSIEDEIGLGMDASLNKLTQELGEFNDAVQKFRGIYCQNKGDLAKVEDELGDLIANIISVCHKLGIDSNNFSKYAENTLRKLEKRKELYKANMRQDENH